MKIKAAVLHRTKEPFRIETVDLEPPRAGEALVRVQAAGVCHSDWHVAQGDTQHPLPVVCGHEGCGVIEALGPGVTGLREGQRVALNWQPSCGKCFYCARGRPALCAEYTDPVWRGGLLDGTPRLALRGKPVYHYCALACFAEKAVVPAISCVPIGEDLPGPVAALLGCAVATGAGAVANTAAVPPGASVAVLGAGGVGLCAVAAARAVGAEVVLAIDRVAAKEAVARRMGATHFAAADADPFAKIRELTGGRGADFVFEAVGHPKLQEQCLRLVRPGGTVVLVGLSPMGSATNLPGAVLTRRELTVMGSYYGSIDAARDFPKFAEDYRAGRLPLDALITRTYGLHEINEAYAALLAGALARAVIVF